MSVKEIKSITLRNVWLAPSKNFPAMDVVMEKDSDQHKSLRDLLIDCWGKEEALKPRGKHKKPRIHVVDKKVVPSMGKWSSEDLVKITVSFSQDKDTREVMEPLSVRWCENKKEMVKSDKKASYGDQALVKIRISKPKPEDRGINTKQYIKIPFYALTKLAAAAAVNREIQEVSGAVRDDHEDDF